MKDMEFSLSTNSIKLLNKIGFNTLENKDNLILRKLIFMKLNKKKKYVI